MNQTTRTALTWIGGILGGGLGLTILGFAMQFWIALNVSHQLTEAGIVPKHEVAAIVEDVSENTADISTIEQRWNTFIDTVAASRIEDGQ